jgi:hypothetical protein
MAEDMLFRLLRVVLSLLSCVGAVCCVWCCRKFFKKGFDPDDGDWATVFTAVSSKARAFVKTANKRFCMIERQFLKHGKDIGPNVSRAVK